MKPTRLLRHVPVLLLLGLLSALLILGCTEKPTAPVYNNPFDPDNPESANPFELTAIENQGTVRLFWNQLEGFGIVEYIVERRTSDSGWVSINTLAATTGQATATDADPVPTTVNDYRVVGVDEFGTETSTSDLVPVTTLVPPIISNAADTNNVYTSRQDLTVSATRGDLVELSLSEDLADPTVLPRDADDETLFENFDLRPGFVDASTPITVYTRTETDLGEGLPPAYSGTGTKNFTIVFNPTITLLDGGTTIAEPVVDLLISREAVGVDSMRFAGDDDDLMNQPWQPGAEIAHDVPVRDSVQPQTVWGAFLSDFGFITRDSLNIQADDLSTADFALDLPGNRISPTPAVTLLHDAVALMMRTSQYPDFHDAPWTAYSDTSEVVIEPIADQYVYVIYSQYQNYWFSSPIRSDWVILGDAEVQVQFSYPLQDMVVEGGTTIEVRGTADTFDATYPVTGVQTYFDDDEGWQDATGTNNWETVWEVPLLTEDTTWQIGALATAEDDNSDAWKTGRAWITVTISQFLINLVEPADATEITRGTFQTISGTATPYLGGAPLDSVVVKILGERLPSPEPLEDWSVTWPVPAEGGVQLVDIVATAFAGADSLSENIQVTLVPSSN